MNRIDVNPGNYGIDTLGPAESENKGSGGGWGYQTTMVYSGQFYDEDGLVSFYENIDDNAYLMVDGRTLLDDDVAGIGQLFQKLISGVVVGLTLNFEWAMFTVVGQGLVQWGSGFDPTGQATSTNYQDYILPRNSDAFTADLFRARGSVLEDLDLTLVEGEGDSDNDLFGITTTGALTEPGVLGS